MKEVYTTSEVARIFSVAPRTVSKWFDSGLLRGYRIPLSKDRRIPHNNLVAFATENGMPMAALGCPADPDRLVSDSLANVKAFASGDAFDVAQIKNDCTVLLNKLEGEREKPTV